MLIKIFTLILVLIILPACIEKSTLLDPDLIYIKDEEPERLKDVIQQPIKNMNFAEAAYAYKYYKRNEYIDMAIKAAQRMLTVGGDPDIMKDTMLDLSQMYLDKKDYDKAIKYAIEYKNLYPGSLGYQKACYIEIMSHFMSISSYECDHSDALKTIELSNEFLKKYPDDNQYKEFIQQMIDSCYNILLQKEIHVINSYIAKYKRYKRITSITAAKRRILYIKKNIAPYLENANIVASNIENDIDKLIENR